MAELKKVNPGAIEYFSTRGRKYLKAREEIRDLGLLEVEELGDLDVETLRTFAESAEQRAAKGLESLDQWERTYEDTAAAYKIMTESPETPEEQKSDILRSYYGACETLSLINLFKNIIVALNNSKSQAIKYSEAIKNNLPTILSAINADDIKSIKTSTQALGSLVVEFVSAVGEYESASEAYRQSIQKSPEVLKLQPISRESAKELIDAMVTAIYKYTEEKTKNPSKAPELERTIIGLEDGIRSIEVVIGSPLTRRLRDEIEQKLENEQKQKAIRDQENRLIEYKGQLSAAINGLYKATIKKYKTAGWPIDGEQKAIILVEDIHTNKFQDIDMEKRDNIFVQMMDDMQKRLKKYYTDSFYMVLQQADDIKDQINGLKDLSKLTDEEIKIKYEEIVANVEKLGKSSQATELHVETKAENGVVSIKFNNPKVSDLVVPVLSKELMDKLYPKLEPKIDPKKVKKEPDPNKQKQQKTATDPEPVQPAPAKNTSEAEDVELYLQLLRETNAQIVEINKINTQLLLHDKLSDLSMAAIDADVAYEDTAVYQSALLTRRLLDLSEIRYNYLKKHGKYIVSNEEVKNTPLDEVRFGADFEEFMRSRDELIIDTEIRILELDRNKPAGYEEQIAKLQSFIKAQNSLVNRFLVSESVSRRIDVAKFLEERNARRKAIRDEKLKEIEASLTGTEPTQVTEEQKKVTPQTDEPAQTGPVVEEKPKEKKPEEKQPEDKKQEEQPSEGQEVPVPEEEPVVSRDIPHTKIDIRENKLNFNPRNRRSVAKKITENDVLFQGAPKVTTQIIKNGIRIQFSKQLRERLAELNAKISLVNNKVKASRTSRLVDADAEYQDVTFKKDHDVNHQDYSVEIRIPGEKRSEVLFDDINLHHSR